MRDAHGEHVMHPDAEAQERQGDDREDDRAVADERPAGEDRLFMGFSVQDRVDLADHDAVAAAVNAHLPEATVTTTAGHDWVGDRFSKGTWLSVPPTWFSDGTFDALALPEGRLAFAGSDIAPEGAGWIEGAVGSGAAAADYLQARFRNG